MPAHSGRQGAPPASCAAAGQPVGTTGTAGAPEREGSSQTWAQLKVREETPERPNKRLMTMN